MYSVEETWTDIGACRQWTLETDEQAVISACVVLLFFQRHPDILFRQPGRKRRQFRLNVLRLRLRKPQAWLLML